jgi:L-threonylcarbamoyladenylate synthase
MRVIRTSQAGIEAALADAAAIIRTGGIVAYPTETFYGLGVCYSDTPTLERLFLMKRRPKGKPMPLIIGDISSLAVVSPDTGALAPAIIGRFWPGPLTILFPAHPGLSDFITGGSGRVAVRVPGRSFALYLARNVGCPLTATSANISGMPPANSADEVAGYFGDAVDLLIDGGPTPGGKPSTIIDMSEGGITLVREGVVPYEEILEAVKGRR